MEHKESIRLMLESLPNKIMLKEKEMLKKSEEADKLELETKSTEVSYERQIAGEMIEVEDKKQKKFKNENERKKELDIKLARNEIYRSNLRKISELRKELKEESILLSYLKRRFRAGIGLSRLGE